MSQLIDELAPDSRMTSLTCRRSQDALREHDRFLVTHENPDGDALGSLLAATLAPRAPRQGRVMYLSGDVPLPAEYRFMPLDDVLRGRRPPTPPSASLLAVDCANDSRLGAGRRELLERAARRSTSTTTTTTRASASST